MRDSSKATEVQTLRSGRCRGSRPPGNESGQRRGTDEARDFEAGDDARGDDDWVDEWGAGG